MTRIKPPYLPPVTLRNILESHHRGGFHYKRPVTREYCIKRLLRNRAINSWMPRNKNSIKCIGWCYLENYLDEPTRHTNDVDVKKNKINEWVESAIGTFESFLNVEFNEIDFKNWHTYEKCDYIIRFGFTQNLGAGLSGLTYYPLFHAHSKKEGVSYTGGDSWVQIKVENLHSASWVNYYYFVLLHEMGHALGLEHPHDDDPKPIEQDKSQYWGNHTNFTVMSYEGDSVGLMHHDILALQQLWGRQKPDTTENLTLMIYTNNKGYICREIWDQFGWFGESYGFCDDANVKLVNCQDIQEPLYISDSGVYYYRTHHKVKPICIFTDYTKPNYIISGKNSDRIQLSSKHPKDVKNTPYPKNIVLSLRGDDIIFGSRGEDTIILGANHGDVTIHLSSAQTQIVFLIDQKVRDILTFTQDRHDNIIITNTKTRKKVKLMQAFRRLSRLTIYDWSGLSQQQKNLLQQIKKDGHDFLLKFHPQHLSDPIYGYDKGTKILL